MVYVRRPGTLPTVGQIGVITPPYFDFKVALKRYFAGYGSYIFDFAVSPYWYSSQVESDWSRLDS